MEVNKALEQVPVDDIEQAINANLLLVLILAVVLVVVYVVAERATHLLVRRALQASSGDFDQGGVTAVELEKRARTLEGLTTSLVRAAVVGGLVFLLIGYFGLWSVLTGLALALAALTIAGQSIVLDYLMGILIVLEGTYFEGDSISAGDPAWAIAGTVEVVGLRRTTLRAPDGTVFSVSNAEMRTVANRTRIYAAGEVMVGGIRDEDLDAVIAIMDRVGAGIATDRALAGYVLEPHKVAFVGDPDDLGWSVFLRGRVIAGQRWLVGTEIRKRLNRAFLEAGIELNKRGVAPRIARSGGNAAPTFVPEGDDE